MLPGGTPVNIYIIFTNGLALRRKRGADIQLLYRHYNFPKLLIRFQIAMGLHNLVE
jgi:hypothetical protein